MKSKFLSIILNEINSDDLQTQYNQIKSICKVNQKVAEILLAYCGSLDKMIIKAVKEPTYFADRLPDIDEELGEQIVKNLIKYKKDLKKKK